MDYISLAEETKKLDAAIKDGSFSCIDVYGQDVKRNRLDWVNRKVHEMLEEGKNVLKVGLIESGAWEDSTKLKYQTLYFVGWDEMGEPCLVGRKPQGFVYTGTHKEICPIRRANGHVKKGTMEVIDYKDSKCIIVDNLKDYDEALKATVGTERKILQVHGQLPYVNKVSSLDAVRMIPEDSNLVIVNSTGRFDFVDEHIYDSVENYIDRKEKLDVLRNKHENAGELTALEGFGDDKVNELGIFGLLYCERILNPHDVSQKVFVADDDVKLVAFDWNGNYAEKLMYEKTDIPGVYQSTLLTREGMEIGLVTLDPDKMGKMLGLKCVPAKDKKMSAELDLSDNKEKIMSEYPVFKKREDLLSDKSLINENDSVKELLLDVNGNVYFKETFVPGVESPFIHRVCASAIKYGDDWDIANVRQNLNTVFRSSSMNDWHDFTQLDNAYGGNVHNYVPLSEELGNGDVEHPVCFYACCNEKSHEDIYFYAVFQESADGCKTEFMMYGHLNENRLEKFANALKTDGIMESFGYKDSKVLDALKDFRKKNETEKEMPVELDLSEVGKRKERHNCKGKGM